jgi:hypothetical protein
MNQRLIDLGIRRGRLLERIASQRSALAYQLAPLREALSVADRAVAGLRRGTDYVKQHPGLALAALAVLVIVKPCRAWRWARRGFIAWRSWVALRERFAVFGLRSGR